MVLEVKNLPANAGDASSIPKSGRPPGEGNGNPLQYSCLENSIDRGACTVHGVAKSQTRLSHTHTHTHTPLNPLPSMLPHNVEQRSMQPSFLSCDEAQHSLEAKNPEVESQISALSFINEE